MITLNEQNNQKTNTKTNMKKTMTSLKAGLVGLILTSALTSSAQQLIGGNDPGSLQPPLSGTGTEAIFVHGGSGFTLTASTTSTAEGGASGIAFTDFDWLFRNAAGGGDGVSALTSASATPGGTVNSELNVTNLAPGFYTFIAQGVTDGEICSSEPEEFTVFVLAPLTVTLSLDGDASLLYCMDDMAANTLTANAAFDTNVTWNAETDITTNPALSDFELRYRWYKVTDGTTFDISSETPFTTSTPSTNTTENSYTFDNTNDTAVGQWNYYVAVDYTVKTSGPYTNVLGSASTPTVIEVTPKPGKPTITIQAN